MSETHESPVREYQVYGRQGPGRVMPGDPLPWTDEGKELAARQHAEKLAAQELDDAAITAGATEAEEIPADEIDATLEQFATGGGWYEIGGEKYHGKDAALEALDALTEPHTITEDGTDADPED